MFVVINQARTGIINFNNVSCIAIRKKSIIAYLTGTAYFIRVETTCGTYEDLGKYYTESRAREVLQEIIRCYAATEELKCVVNINSCLGPKDINKLAENSFIYEIPED